MIHLDPQAAGGDAPKLDPVQLVLHASIPVKLVLVILVAVLGPLLARRSARRRSTSRARAASRSASSKAFDTAGSLDALAQQGLAAFRGSPFARIFATGYDEMVRLTRGERGKRLDEAQGTHVESVTRRAAAPRSRTSSRG